MLWPSRSQWLLEILFKSTSHTFITINILLLEWLFDIRYSCWRLQIRKLALSGLKILFLIFIILLSLRYLDQILIIFLLLDFHLSLSSSLILLFFPQLLFILLRSLIDKLFLNITCSFYRRILWGITLLVCRIWALILTIGIAWILLGIICCRFTSLFQQRWWL